MPSWRELEELSQKEMDQIGIQDAGSSSGGAAPGRNVARAPSVWKQATQAEFARGKATNVLITSAGELVLAPQAAKLHDSADRFLWGQAADSRGNVYVGTWLDGSVLRIDAKGEVTSYFRTEDTAVQSLCIDSRDNLYVGTLPSGTITRIAPDGTATKLCRLEGEFVWALQCDRAGALYAATGSRGRLYRIDAEGAAKVIFTAPDRHLMALVSDPNDGIYVGTYPRGKVYRVLADGNVQPVFEVPNAAVQSLAIDGKGNLYVGCSPRAAIYKVAPDGTAQVWYQGLDRHIMGLIAESDGTLYAAAGTGGKLYRISPDKTVATLFNSETSYALSMSRDAGGSLYATTAGPSRVYRFPALPAESGNYVSPVHNATNLARWGVMRWSGSAEAEALKLQTRTGNTAFPDGTWSDWSEASTVSGQQIQSPPGQYAQYRVLLAPGKHGPTVVRSVELFYLTRNRAPEVAIASPAREIVWSGRKNVRWAATDPDRDRLEAELSYSREGTLIWTKIEEKRGGNSVEAQLQGGDEPAVGAAVAPVRPSAKPAPAVKQPARPKAPRVRPGGVRRRVAVRPAATPVPVQNAPGAAPGAAAEEAEDEVVARGAPGEIEEENTDESADASEVEWDTRRVPDGRYRLKVVVTDGRMNPSEPLTAEKISDWFLVDNTPPTVRRSAIRRDAQGLPLSIPCSDALSYLTGADYRIDGGEWIGAACEDGIWDSTAETALLDAKKLLAGKHAIEFRIRDAAGNSRVEKLSYTLAAPKPGR
jgi:sugar lactone lactonase YvrE